MKFLHTSDLHIGKRLHETSLLEDQKYILNQIINIAKEQAVDAVLISGDVYDKSIPQADAVTIFDRFITELSNCEIKVFMISGNHDSAQRLDFMSELLKDNGVYFCGSYKGELECITLSDEFGELNVYLLPFIKPSNVRQYFENEEIESHESAVKFVIENADIDYSKRNIILSHQFITGSTTDGSEELIIGGLDNISSQIYQQFDYTALGHIHRAQSVGCEKIRYSGTPLKYSFSEANHNKSVTIINLLEKGNVNITPISLTPLRDLRCIKGKFSEVTDITTVNTETIEDFIKVTLTDEYDIPDAIMKLRSIFPNILALDYDNNRTRAISDVNHLETQTTLSPFEMFESLYKTQFGAPLEDEQVEILNKLIEKIWEADK